MIDHTGLIVSNYQRSRDFYLQALGAIGYELLAEFSAEQTGSKAFAGFGEAPKPDFWISAGAALTPIHVAFRVASRMLVDKFHSAAMAAGGTDNGAPGPRPHYHQHYYGAFVLDPDGHNVEAVCHEPPPPLSQPLKVRAE